MAGADATIPRPRSRSDGMIQTLIDSALVLPSLSSTTKEEVLDEMLQHAADSGGIKAGQRASLRKALLAREETGSTGIGNGVAVPHVKSKNLDDMVLIVGRSEGGVPYQSVDGRDVQIVFMVLASEAAPEAHLQVLRWISTLARNADFRRFLVGTDEADGIRELLHEMSPK